MTMKIFGGPGFTNVGRVLLTLFEKGVDESEIEIIHIDFLKEEQKSPAHLKLQPFAQIPVFQDGDMLIYESRAIARTIERKYATKGTPLYGSSPKDAALTEQWLEVEAQNYTDPIMKISYEQVINPVIYNKATDHDIISAETPKLEKVLDVYEKRLSKSKYLAGNFFSLADLSHIPWTYYMIALGNLGAIFDNRPHVKAWYTDLFSRPSTQKWVEMAAPHFNLFRSRLVMS